jgi:Zn-finger nucleic acid-binding protein
VVACISCGKALQPAGKALHCRCGGAWLAEGVLLEMAAHVRGAVVRLPWAMRVGTPRPCPMCTAGMQTVELGGIQLDRCAPHGIWFDANELDAVLSVSRGFPLAATSTRFDPTPRAKRPSLDLLSDLRGAFFEESK